MAGKYIITPVKARRIIVPSSNPRAVVNFKEDCVDPLAKLVMLEAMNFAIEKAESRLESLGKVFPTMEDIAIPIIQDIVDIRHAIENLTVCSAKQPEQPSTPPPAPPELPKIIGNLPKEKQALVEEMPPHLQPAMAAELLRTEPEKPKEEKPKEEKPKKQTPKEEPKEAPKKERTQPTSWGPLEFKGMVYSSPGAFLSALHGGDVTKIRGKGNYVKQLDADGFDVYIGDKKIPPDIKQEDLEKLKGFGLRVELKKGIIKAAPAGGVKKESADYPEPWTMVTDATGKMLFIEDANKKPVPENVWRIYTSDQLDKKMPYTRRA